MKDTEISSEVEWPYGHEAMTWMDKQTAFRKESRIIEKELVDKPVATIKWWKWYLSSYEPISAEQMRDLEALCQIISSSSKPFISLSDTCTAESKRSHYRLLQQQLESNPEPSAEQIEGLESLRRSICAAANLPTPDPESCPIVYGTGHGAAIAAIEKLEWCLGALEKQIVNPHQDEVYYYLGQIWELASLGKIISGKSNDELEFRTSLYYLHRRGAMNLDENLKVLGEWRIRCAELKTDVASDKSGTDEAVRRIMDLHHAWRFDSFDHDLDWFYRDARYIAAFGLAAYEKFENGPKNSSSTENSVLQS